MASPLDDLGNAYQSLGEYQQAIDFQRQSLEIKGEIGDHKGESSSLFKIATTLAKLDNHAQALLNYQKSQAIYEELELNNMVEKCKKAINEINQIIAPQHQAPPTLAIPRAIPKDDWWERNLPANDRKAAANRQSSSNLWWLFAAGFALAILIYWLKR